MWWRGSGSIRPRGGGASAIGMRLRSILRHRQKRKGRSRSLDHNLAAQWAGGQRSGGRERQNPRAVEREEIARGGRTDASTRGGDFRALHIASRLPSGHYIPKSTV